jgi:phosphate uptake regulator
LTDALADQDQALAGGVISGEGDLRRIHCEVEAESRVLLAGPLREAAARQAMLALTGSLNLSRVASHANKIAHLCPTCRLDSWRRMPWAEVQHMAGMSVSLLNQAVAALASGDRQLARATRELAGSIDALYIQKFDALPGYLAASPRLVNPYSAFSRAIQELGRVGDRALEIAESVMEI